MSYAYCDACYYEHYCPKPINTFEKCKSCGKFNGVKTYNKPVSSAYCSGCFKEHKTQNPPSTFAKCTGCGKFNGLKFSTNNPYTYCCNKCKAVFKTHEKITTFAKCLACGAFNGLKWDKNEDVILLIRNILCFNYLNIKNKKLIISITVVFLWHLHTLKYQWKFICV